jgi:hypothetical protein
MPKPLCAAPELASLLDGSSAGDLIPELARHGLQKLIKLELSAFLRADWHERTEERLGHLNGYRPRTLTTVEPVAHRAPSVSPPMRGVKETLNKAGSSLPTGDNLLKETILNDLINWLQFWAS